MPRRRPSIAVVVSVFAGLALVLLHLDRVRAQSAPPRWSGIAGNDALAYNGQQFNPGSNDMYRKSLGDDGRFVVFHSSIEALVPGDTNNWNDVFLRDRLTGELTRVSVASDGTQANGYSQYPSISGNGRYISFYSCASNLVADDTNGLCDAIVHDREQHTTVRINVDTAGRPSVNLNGYSISMSRDGRYVAFAASFDPGSPSVQKVWLRDRDADGDGVFDEPGEATTVQISEANVGSDVVGSAEIVAISGDARFIAYTASANNANWESIGTRMYVYYREAGITVRIDTPSGGNPDVVAYAGGPDLSDAGHLVYSTNAPNLVDGDTRFSDDVFLFNLYTGGHVRLQLTHANAPSLYASWSPAISADGRYVAFLGVEQTPSYGLLYSIYAIDRDTSASYEISVKPDGVRVVDATTPSISADGSAVAFAAEPDMLVDNWGNRGVFVATDVSLTPSAIDVPAAGGTFTIELTAPVNTKWTLRESYAAALQAQPASGVGPASILVTIGRNESGNAKESWLILGSEQVTLRQPSTPIAQWVGPPMGPTSGGTNVQISGAAFVDGATVTFAGVPATNVVFVDSTTINATTPAHVPAGFVPVVVTNPDGNSSTIEYGFQYTDSTPPVITRTVTGTIGSNDWYISDVTVQWTVRDDESAIENDPPCPDTTLTTDTAFGFAACNATSGGGSSFDQIVIKRDTTPPDVFLFLPEPRVYTQGEQVQVFYNCNDETAGIVSCTGTQPDTSFINTSAVGTFSLTVTGEDFAGHQSSRTLTYTVKTPTTIDVPAATGLYGGATSLRATLRGLGVPMAGKVLAFYIDNAPAGTATTDTAGEAVVPLPLDGRNAGSCALRAEYAGDDNTIASVGYGVLTVEKLTPAVSWLTPASIAEGTALSGTQLNASTTVPGTFAYTPAAGTLLAAGTHTLSTTFTPQDTTNYNTATATVTLVVKAVPVITWATPVPISYPLSLGYTQLNATANVTGTFTYDPPLGTVLPAGTHALTVTFTPTDTAHYVNRTASVTLVVNKGVPVITWPNPYGIVYGTPLSATQLNATATTTGTFAYTPPAGTVLPAGTHTLSVVYAPSDPANYESVTASVSQLVGRATPGISWPDPAEIVYGTPLGPTHLNATSNVPGTFTYNPAPGTVLDAGSYQLFVTLTPDDIANYEPTTYYASLTVQRAPTTITWAAPAPIVYGTSLTATQLNATASVPGTFTYTPGFGATLDAGTHSLLASFSPADSANYSGTYQYVTLIVEKRTPVITWSNPAPIVYGTPLGWTQLNATKDVGEGELQFNPPHGTVLNAGAGQTLNVTFVAYNNNYNPASASVTIDVLKAAPAITWANPQSIPYGTPLDASQLNATANTPGTVAYAPAAGTVLPAGSHTLSATFTPNDSANYAVSTTTVPLNVFKATPVVAWQAPLAITYGTALSSPQLNATANVAGTFTYSPAAGTVLDGGTRTLWATFAPDDSANYNTPASISVQIDVLRAAPVVTWPAPAPIVYGTALSSTQLNASANTPGTLTYSPAAGSVLSAGSQLLSVTFAPLYDYNYTSATATVTIEVVKATPQISWSAPSGISYGTALSSTQLNATANVSGTFSYSPAAGTVLGAGTQPLAVTFTPADAANYTSASASTAMNVSPVPLTVRTNNASKVCGEALPAFTATGTGFVNGDTLASLNGTLAFSTSATATSAPGNYNVTPGGVTSANYTITFAAGTLTIAKASTALSLTSTPNPSVNKQTVQLRAVVAAVAPGAGTPTGSVEFRDNGVLLGAAPLVNGVATLNVSFRRGTHPLTASFAGDANFTGSSGTRTHQTN